MSLREKERMLAKDARAANTRPPIPYGFKEYRPCKMVLLGGPVPRPVALFVFAEEDGIPYGVRAHSPSPGARVDGRAWRQRKVRELPEKRYGEADDRSQGG